METLTHLKPRLKTGTIILPLPSRTFVGNSHEGIEIFSSSRVAIAHLNGLKSCLEIGRILDIPVAEIEELVHELDEAHLLDTSVGKLSVHSRYHSRNEHRASHDSDDSNDGAYQQMQAKISSELSFTTWLDGVRDGGVRAISERRNVNIAIYGDSRIATLLYGILLASGLSKTILHASQKRMIGEEDLCAGFLRPSDIGAPLSARVKELAGELSLFPLSRQSNDRLSSQSTGEGSTSITSREVAVAIGEPPADLIQGWMSTGTPHLLVDTPDGASLVFGPLVIPGQTPCARCIALAREEQSEIWSGVDWQRNILPSTEVPVSVAHHIAGLIALELLRYIDSGDSEMIGSRVRCNYHSPLQGGRIIYARHPACGCSW